MVFSVAFTGGQGIAAEGEEQHHGVSNQVMNSQMGCPNHTDLCHSSQSELCSGSKDVQLQVEQQRLKKSGRKMDKGQNVGCVQQLQSQCKAAAILGCWAMRLGLPLTHPCRQGNQGHTESS